MRLLLARHGQSVWNQVRRVQGRMDVALSETGRDQARRYLHTPLLLRKTWKPPSWPFVPTMSV